MKWNPVDALSQLDDLDFADGLAHISLNHEHMKYNRSDSIADSSEPRFQYIQSMTLKVKAKSMQ